MWNKIAIGRCYKAWISPTPDLRPCDNFPRQVGSDSKKHSSK